VLEFSAATIAAMWQTCCTAASMTAITYLPTIPALDRLARPLRDLRVSVTDRCNFRCTYCMPREHFGGEHRFLPRAQILSFEEITRVVSLARGLGVHKVRLTGGEPLLRAELPELCAMLSGIGGLDLALTTNGSLLERHAQALADAGLGRLTVSLDSLDDERRMADADYSAAGVLRGIEAAERAGFQRIKVNCVVRRGVNDGEIVPLARRFKGSGHVVRFIEFMDVGLTNGWRTDAVVTGREIVDRLDRELGLVPLSPSYRGEVARRYGYRDGSGEVGVITSVSQPFCGDCARLRLAADGKLYTCLFSASGHDLRPLLRSGADDEALTAFIQGIWQAREDRYSELRSERTRGLPRPEMSYVGG
jgi:cyclic pyranopterin phosphate synthase